MKVLQFLLYTLSLAVPVNAWLSSYSTRNRSSISTTTTTSIFEQRIYSKGAEIYPQCNKKLFTLADSFPNGAIPPQAQSILKAKAPSLHQQQIIGEDDAAQGSRRNFILGISSAVAAGAALQLNSVPNEYAMNSASPIKAMGISEAIQWIDDNCDRRFLHAIIASDYSFLYYGVDGAKDGKPSIHTEKFNADLLSLDTYGTKEAVDYFQSVESILAQELVKPSNGHLMSTSPKDAAKWGTAASIWPVNGAHYAWFQDGGLFYPRDNDVRSIVRDDFIVDGKDCGRESLEDALKTDGCEIMVTADNFLVVPASQEVELRDALKGSFLV
jgi:hypothetical protein